MSVLLLIEYSLEVASGKGFCKDLDKDYYRIGRSLGCWKAARVCGVEREPNVLHWSLFFVKENWKLVFRADGPKAQTQRQNLGSKDLDFCLGRGCVGFSETNVEPREVVFISVDQALSPNSPVPLYSFSLPTPSAIHFAVI